MRFWFHLLEYPSTIDLQYCWLKVSKGAAVQSVETILRNFLQLAYESAGKFKEEYEILQA
jgi:hypothetical protein